MIAYHIRQSFSPDDKITPQVANEIGCKLADKITHGNHAYIVATHTDKSHIHSHIIFNSTNLTCDKKFRDFLGSGKAVMRISDRLCLEYGLSIVENPKKQSKNYGKWLEEANGKPRSHSDILRQTIYEVMEEKPQDFEAFLQKMVHRGYSTKQGKHLAFINADMKKYMRCRSLGDDFTEENLRKVIEGKAILPKLKIQKPSKNQTKPSKDFSKASKDFSKPVERNVNLLIDIDKALQEKGAGYQNWAKKFNLKQMANTVNYLTENNLMNYKKLEERASGISGQYTKITAEIKAKESRLAEIKEIQEHIVHYAKTKDTYKAYHQSGYSKKFKADHEGDLLLHETARDFFKNGGYKTFPKMAELREERGILQAEKNKLYTEYYKLKDENKDIINAKTNIEVLLEIQKEEQKDNNERKSRE